MNKQIITIDKEKCVGCGLCVNTCHQGAIGLVDGKAQLLREDYCDGLGRCLPMCPTNAISFTMKDIPNTKTNDQSTVKNAGSSCSSVKPMVFKANNAISNQSMINKPQTQLRQWPIQIKLVSPNSSFLKNAEILIAADCSAYAYANFHNEFMKNKVTIIGCPKLDDIDYSNKLKEIFSYNDINSITVVRMEVPCCTKIESYTTKALNECGKNIPYKVITISCDGIIL